MKNIEAIENKLNLKSIKFCSLQRNDVVTSSSTNKKI